jgi:hypothetical protein
VTLAPHVGDISVSPSTIRIVAGRVAMFSP